MIPTRFRNLDELVALLRGLGSESYGGESVTQLEHGLQAATRADASGADRDLVLAALLHDVGHLLLLRAGVAENHAQDLGHANAGARALSGLLGRPITEPIRLHVLAKRFLVSTVPDYRMLLSPESHRSLRTQGGVMSDRERKAFLAEPYAEAALQLRRFDEEAKVPRHTTRTLDDYLPLLCSAVHANSREEES